ncbi:MAG: hypothetical protein ABI629_19420 [bacterium]
MRSGLAVLLGICLVGAAVARAEDAGGPPHHMTKSDGSLDMEVCAACHTEDMSLQRSKLETCTLCHAQTVHAGSDEHLREQPAEVKQALAARPKDSPALPLSEDGHIWCGTCHLFHDPAVMQEDWLKQGWLPPDSGLSGNVRQAVIDRWVALAAKSDDKNALGQFAAKGTRQLRLPASDGQLCRQCHTKLP